MWIPKVGERVLVRMQSLGAERWREVIVEEVRPFNSSVGPTGMAAFFNGGYICLGGDGIKPLPPPPQE